ncbi:hypothetical protein ATCC90586_011050 [Pythium insidiosum]|nr:hypothetical protein ATCC90586_011050 [Pythium insidiosum]
MATATHGRVAHAGWIDIPVNASLELVAQDGQWLCGVTNESHQVFCKGVGLEGAPWRWIASDAVSVAVQDDHAWVIDRYNWIRYRNLSDAAPWQRLEHGWARGVATDGNVLCTLWLGYHAFCTVTNVVGAAPTRADVQAIDVLTLDVHDGIVFAVAPDGSTKYLPANASYPNSAGPYQSISSDGTFVCASKTKTDAVYCVEKSQETWHPIGGRLRQLVVREGRLYGVARNGTLWTTTLKASTSNDDGELKRLEAKEKAAEGTCHNDGAGRVNCL